MQIDRKINFNSVYYLESQNPNMNPIAIRPELTPSNYAAWEDTSNGRIIRFSKILLNDQEIQEEAIGLSPERIEIIDLNGQSYKLVKLTVAIFNEKLKDHVAGGASLNFATDQELQDYYLKTDFQTIG